MKHHYIPAFYLSRWAVSGRVVEFAKVHGGKVVAKPKAPEATGFKHRLYEMKGWEPKLAQQVEEGYFKPIDTMAADALEMLYRHGHNAGWTAKSRTAWTRFVLSLLLRCPEDIDAFREWWHDDFGRTDAEGEERYKKWREPSDPATFSEYLISQPLSVKEAYLFTVLNSLLEHDSVGTHINNMNWRVLETPIAGPRLLTSDRPVIRSNNLNGEKGHIALPIGPRLLFIASHDLRFLNDLLRTDQTGLVKECNRQVVEGAVRFIYASDAKQARFIQNRFGNQPQPRLMEQIIGRRRSLDGAVEITDR
ncbi:hypothetical protein J2T08_003605 [Neorhizobium galegae]|uniref:DUF4238 domain-containing protein n=1 Tax=Neorhizobium galegae TaxID=399 RepID=UPI00277F1884|nr:DUF4238 domain-containing protein [Neorhizobium galegae]MDQ0135684.1 hypothetical protein [Neorhizobium galegae]